MCGRYALVSTNDALKQHFGVSAGFVMQNRYNIAPTQMIPVVLGIPRSIRFLRWGFVPPWAGSASAQFTGFVNARIETASEKPSFKESLRFRRGLVIASGYYEWQLGPKGQKQPYYISTEQQPLLGLGAIYSGDTVAILTKEASPLLCAIHPRMPVLIDSAEYGKWLNISTPLPEALAMATQSQNVSLQAYPVSTYVNSVHRGSAECLYRVPALYN